MKKTIFTIPILILLSSCSPEMVKYYIAHYGSTHVIVKNEGRFVMSIEVLSEYRRVPVGQTATFIVGVGEERTVRASYYDDRLDNGGHWETSVKPSNSDDIELTIPDCPGWSLCSPGLGYIDYCNGLFVAFGTRNTDYPGLSGNAVFWSRDGAPGSWTPSKNARYAEHIAFGNGRFVVPGAWTTDVVTGEWTPSDDGTRYGGCVAYGNDSFVVMDYVKAVWSPDATAGSWTQSTVPPGAGEDVAFGNGRFVAVGYTQGRVAKATWSTDGSSWHESTIGQGELYRVAYGNGRFVAVYRNLTCSSPDGTEGSWTTTIGELRQSLYDITFGNGQFVALSLSGEIDRSPDGSPGSWTVSRPADELGSGKGLRSITYGNGRFIAVGGGGVVISSPDGTAGSWHEFHMFE